MGLFISSWLGAKLFYFFFDENVSSKNYIRFFFEGGLVLYGGIIFSLIYFHFLSKEIRRVFLNEKYAPKIFLLMLFLGRFGCFLNGCCYGRSIILDKKVYSIPYPIVEMLLCLFLFIQLELKKKFYNIKDIFLIYAIFRFFAEYLRGDIFRGQYGLFSTSQWISLTVICYYIFKLRLFSFAHHRE